MAAISRPGKTPSSSRVLMMLSSKGFAAFNLLRLKSATPEPPNEPEDSPITEKSPTSTETQLESPNEPEDSPITEKSPTSTDPQLETFPLQATPNVPMVPPSSNPSQTTSAKIPRPLRKMSRCCPRLCCCCKCRRFPRRAIGSWQPNNSVPTPPPLLAASFVDNLLVTKNLTELGPEKAFEEALKEIFGESKTQLETTLNFIQLDVLTIKSMMEKSVVKGGTGGGTGVFGKLAVWWRGPPKVNEVGNAENEQKKAEENEDNSCGE